MNEPSIGAAGCCSPKRGADSARPPTDGDSGIPASGDAPAGVGSAPPTTAASRASAPAPERVVIPAGEFLLGEDSQWAYDSDGESPVVRARVEAFALDRHPVTVEQFAGFVAATGYRTEAERYGWSFVFGGHLPDDFPETRAVSNAPWWRQVEGASWIAPEGPGSSVDHRAEHPVVHVSWNDALAYCTWARSRLPEEVEWERAARAGTETTFPWGDELEPGGRHMANVFQGRFPDHDTAEDGWAGTSPVGSFPANTWGLLDMIGNVWEWTADAFSVPRGGSGPDRVLKGGSHLCHISYCHRYRPAARLGNAPNTSTSHIGFRTAAV